MAAVAGKPDLSVHDAVACSVGAIDRAGGGLTLKISLAPHRGSDDRNRGVRPKWRVMGPFGQSGLCHRACTLLSGYITYRQCLIATL
jgi:hypothetical protein